MTDIVVSKLNAVWSSVSIEDRGISQELMEYFSFYPQNYKHMPAYKNGSWDGKIRLYTPFKKTVYAGLLPYVKKFCEDRGYEISVSRDLGVKTPVDRDYIDKLCKEIGCKFKPRDYQYEYTINAISEGRSLMVSPTASGKSLIIYLTAQHYIQRKGSRVLLIVPRIGLVNQMAGDFVDYGYNKDNIHKITSGSEKNSDKPIVITTWQSIQRMPKSYFDQYDVVFGDEAHNFEAKALNKIMENMESCYHRFGLTGTLKGSKVHKLVLEGLFGSYNKFVSTSELIENETLAKFKIKILILEHTKEDKSFVAKEKQRAIKSKGKEGSGAKKYSVERDFIVGHERRNNFIKNLLWSIKNKNNLVMFDLVEKHGKVLEPILQKDGRNLHFIHGGVEGDVREEVRSICESSLNNDILASSGTFSTGTNIKNLHNIISTAGGKSNVKVLQTIGRLLRRTEGADDTILYDITDDLSYGGRDNYGLEHLRERIEMYNEEGFDYEIFTLKI